MYSDDFVLSIIIPILTPVQIIVVTSKLPGSQNQNFVGAFGDRQSLTYRLPRFHTFSAPGLAEEDLQVAQSYIDGPLEISIDPSDEPERRRHHFNQATE